MLISACSATQLQQVIIHVGMTGKWSLLDPDAAGPELTEAMAGIVGASGGGGCGGPAALLSVMAGCLERAAAARPGPAPRNIIAAPQNR